MSLFENLMFFNKESITNNIMTSLVGLPLAYKCTPTASLVSSKTLTYKSRHSLRMKQTKPSILPNDIIMLIIREADGGFYKHQDNLLSCLSRIVSAREKEERSWFFDRHEPMSLCWANMMIFFEKNNWITKSAQSVFNRKEGLRGLPPLPWTSDEEDSDSDDDY